MKIFQNILIRCGFLLLFIHFAFRIPPSPTADLLTQSIWTSTETWNDLDADGAFVLDTMACKQDNHWEFRSDNTFILTEHSYKCEPDLTFLDTIQGTWLLANNDSQLKFSFANGEETFSMNVHAIGLNEVVLYFSSVENPNGPVLQHLILHR